MPNFVKVSVENPDEILNAGAYGPAAVVRLQSSPDGVVWGSEATATVTAAVRLYTLYDQDGASDTWYRTRYENAAGTITSDWSDEFQVSDETAGLLCSLYDVTQRVFGTATASNSDQEVILDIIREVSADIEGYTGRWLAPRPMATRLWNTRRGSRVLIPKGIRNVQSVGTATSDQPELGGVYTARTDYQLTPPAMERSEGWPATGIVFGSRLENAWNGLAIESEAGFERVPYDIQGVAIGAVTRRFFGKTTAAAAVSLGPEGGVTILRDIGPDGTRILNRYRRLLPPS